MGLPIPLKPAWLGFKLIEPAPDGAFHKAHVLANLPDTQALNFDHLNDLEFEACVKASSGFLILHVLRHLGSWEKPIVVSV